MLMKTTHLHLVPRLTVSVAILKHDQQDAMLYNTLYYCQRSTCFEWFFRSLSGAQICACGIRYLSDLFAVTASGISKPLKTCRALTVIKSVIQRCILLVMLKNMLTMHGPMNVKEYSYTPALLYVCMTCTGTALCFTF